MLNNREKFLSQRTYHPTIRTQHQLQKRQKISQHEPIIRNPIVQNKTQIELTRYDQLKKTAEQLIQSQLTTQTEHDIARSKLCELEKQVELQIAKIHKLRKDKSQLATMLNAEKTTLEKLCFEVKTLQTLSQSFQSELLEMTNRLKRADDDKQDLKQKLDGYYSKIEEMVKSAKNAEIERENLVKESLQLREQIETLKTEISEKECKFEEQKRILDSTTQKHNELKVEYETLKVSENEKVRKIEHLTELFSKQEEELKNLKSELSITKEKLDTSNAIGQDLEVKIVELNNQIDELRNIKKFLEARINDQKIDIDRLVHNEAQLRKEMERRSGDYQSELSMQQNHIKNIESYNNELKATIENYKEELDKEKINNSNLINEINKLKSILESQKSELQTLSSLKINLVEMKMNFKESLDKKEDEIMELKSMLETKEGEILKLSKEIKLIKESNEIESVSLKETNKSLTKANLELKNDVNELNQKCNHLSKLLEEEQQKYHELNLETEKLKSLIQSKDMNTSSIKYSQESPSKKKLRKQDTTPLKHKQSATLQHCNVSPELKDKVISTHYNDEMEVEMSQNESLELFSSPKKHKSDDSLKSEITKTKKKETLSKQSERKNKETLTPKSRKTKKEFSEQSKSASQPRKIQSSRKSKLIKKKSGPDMFTVANVFDFCG